MSSRKCGAANSRRKSGNKGIAKIFLKAPLDSTPADFFEVRLLRLFLARNEYDSTLYGLEYQREISQESCR